MLLGSETHLQIPVPEKERTQFSQEMQERLCGRK